MSTPPGTMKACQATDYCSSPNLQISVTSGISVPSLAQLSKSSRKHFMLLKVNAVSLAPGDVRVLSGLTREVQGPPSFPYIPCGDCCGVVVDLDEQSNVPFKIGDRVAARFGHGPRDALAEYALVSTKVACKVPDEIPSVDAAALASASPAIVLADRIKKDERVLVIGARGGVGSHLCQILRSRKVSLLIGVSSNTNDILTAPISCDAAFNYDSEYIYTNETYQAEPFDTIIDLSGFGYACLESSLAKGIPAIVKPGNQGGRFLTLVPPSGPEFEIHGIIDALKVFIFPTLSKFITSRLFHRSTLPKYTFAMSLPETNDCVKRMFDLVIDRKLKAVVDDHGPFGFDTASVKEAFQLKEGRHVKGKVVILVVDDDEEGRI